MTDDEALQHLSRRGISDETIALLRTLLPKNNERSDEVPVSGQYGALRKAAETKRDLMSSRPQLDRSKEFLRATYGTEKPTASQARSGEINKAAGLWFKDHGLPKPDIKILMEAAGRGKGPTPKKRLPKIP